MSSMNIEIRKRLYNEIKDLIITYLLNSEYENHSVIEMDFHDDIDFFELVRLNYDIFKMLELNEILKSIQNKINPDISSEDITVVNGIRGRLDMKKYIERDYFRFGSKKYFPCKVLAEEYNTIENKFLYSIFLFAFERMKSIPVIDKEFDDDFNSSIHKKTLINLRKNIQQLLHSGDFANIEFNQTSYSKNQIEIKLNRLLPLVKQKLRKREISHKTYGQVVEWWEEYYRKLKERKDLPIYFYNEKFDDKLFELWLLNSIKNNLIEKYDFEIFSSDQENKGFNPMWRRKSKHIYCLKSSVGGGLREN